MPVRLAVFSCSHGISTMETFVGVSPPSAAEISSKIATALQASTPPAKKKKKSEQGIPEFSMEAALKTFAKSWVKQSEEEYARGREKRLDDLLNLTGLGFHTPPMCPEPLLRLVHEMPTLHALYEPFSRGGGGPDMTQRPQLRGTSSKLSNRISDSI